MLYIIYNVVFNRCAAKNLLIVLLVPMNLPILLSIFGDIHGLVCREDVVRDEMCCIVKRVENHCSLFYNIMLNYCST